MVGHDHLSPSFYEVGPGKQVKLGDNSYQIIRILGDVRGAVADTWLAALNSQSENQVAIRLTRQDKQHDQLQSAGMTKEADVLSTLNAAEDPDWHTYRTVAERLGRARVTQGKRRIVAQLDAGQTETGLPYSVQEYVDLPDLSFTDTGSVNESAVFDIFVEVAEAMNTAHRRSLAFKDFKPPDKKDRIRVHLDESGRPLEIKIIDFNVTGDASDIPTDLTFFGQHFFYQLTGYHMDQPFPPDDQIGEGLSRWDALTLGTKNIVLGFLSQDPGLRFQDMSEALADMHEYREFLHHFGTADFTYSKTQNQIWQLRSKGRHRVVYWITSALQHDLRVPADMRPTIGNWVKQAKDEIEKPFLEPLALAWGTYMTGAYKKAADEFDICFRSTSHSESLRRARIGRAASRLLAAVSPTVADIRKESWFPMMDAVINNLIERNYAKAAENLAAVSRFKLDYPLADQPEFRYLQDYATMSLRRREIIMALGDSDKLPSEKSIPAVCKSLYALREGAERMAKHGDTSVIPQTAIGGVEHRFASVWKALEPQYQAFRTELNGILGRMAVAPDPEQKSAVAASALERIDREERFYRELLPQPDQGDPPQEITQRLIELHFDRERVMNAGQGQRPSEQLRIDDLLRQVAEKDQTIKNLKAQVAELERQIKAAGRRAA